MGFVSQLSLTTGSSSLPAFLARSMFFAPHVVDVVFVASAGALLVNGRLPLRLLAYGAFLVQFLGDALQLFTHYLTGQYLTRLAVENANHVSLLLSPRRVVGAAVALAAALSVPLLTEFARRASGWREAGTLSLAALSLAAVVAAASRALPQDARRIRDDLYEENNVTEESPQQRQLLETFASQVANALERVRLAEEARAAAVEIETERLRSSLLSSVSHDLRTPLGVITGATSTLLQDEATLDPATRRDLLETAHEEAERLNRLVGNLLDMTRLASGAIHPKKEWHPLDEIIGVALHRLEPRLGGRRIDVKLPADLPPIPLDDVLIEQVFINLLENAIKYTTSETPIEIVAKHTKGVVEVEVSDHGPGVPTEERDHVFEKFYRLNREGAQGGAGLGLAICRGLVEAHGGRIWVEDREGGGSRFRFTLPIEGTPPVVAN